MTDYNTENINELEYLEKQGDCEAGYKLGCIYLFGYGVNQNKDKAKVYFKRASKHGLTKALKALRDLEFEELIKDFPKYGKTFTKEEIIDFNDKEIIPLTVNEGKNVFVSSFLLLSQENPYLMDPQKREKNPNIIKNIVQALENKAKMVFTFYENNTYQNDFDINHKLIIMFEEGIGVKQDFLKAIELYRINIKHGWAPSQYRYGIRLVLNPHRFDKFGSHLNFLENFKELDQAEEYVQPEEQKDSLLTEKKDSFLEADNKIRVLGIELIEKAASQNYSDALFALGYFTFLGIFGLNRDLSKAVTYFEKAANQGHCRAQMFLGWMSYEGIGIQKDKEKAYELLSKSVAQINSQAQLLLGKMYKVGKLVEKNLHKAFLLISESAAQKNPEAIYNLGYMYYFGEGVEKDLEKAYRLFHESAFKRKNYESMYYVASILLDTDCGIENNYNKGIDYMLRSAQAGVVKAQLALAIFYWKGFYFKKDIKTALYWALEAANRGSSEAANLLSELLAIMEE